MDREDFNYKTEYAKSNRALCKGCTSHIAKDSLRIALMVQSRHFDGKQPTWYHYSCFFGKCRPKSVDEIEGFHNLRWSDQENVRAQVERTGSSKTGKKVSGGSVKLLTKSLQDFVVQYALSGRSNCKRCGDKIEKDELRISHKEIDEEKPHIGLIDRWHHVGCFVKRRKELGWNDEEFTADMMTNFKSLDAGDKETLKKLLDKKKKKGKKSKEKVTVAVNGSSEENEKVTKQLAKQSELLWKVIDNLKKQDMKKVELCDILEENEQDIPVGMDKIYERVADGMVFGRLPPCSACDNGQLVASGKGFYRCTGNVSGWTSCTFTSQDVKRSEWVIPEQLKPDFPYLKKYKYTPRDRMFPPMPPPKPLKDKSILLMGKLSKTKTELKAKIEHLGGSVTTSLAKAYCCICTKDELQSGKKKVQDLEVQDIFVVSEDFLSECEKMQEAPSSFVSLLKKFSLASWGSERKEAVNGKSMKRMLEEEERGKSKKVKLVVKSGSAVDPESEMEVLFVNKKKETVLIRKYNLLNRNLFHYARTGLNLTALNELAQNRNLWKNVSHVHRNLLQAEMRTEDNLLHPDRAEVLVHNGLKYTATLSMVDMRSGANSYYKLQLLVDTSRKRWHVFRSWGRVGTTIGGTKLEAFSSRDNAIQNFSELYLEKSGNEFGCPHFIKYPRKFYPLDIDYGTEDEAKLKTLDLVGANSSLPPSVQQLIKMIFDIENMKKTMLEFEIDLNKMPLGKLSKKQMQMAYTVLTEAASLVSKDKLNKIKTMDCSNRFYTLIPHDYGMQQPPLLDNEEIIQAKTSMLDALMDIEVAYNLLNVKQEAPSETEDPLDASYKKLNCNIEPVEKDSDEFKMVKEYTDLTHASTHDQYKLIVDELFKINRKGESARFRPFQSLSNRKLLWHGSRTSNYAGILSQGLRIAPPEAPVTGYMFGKGIYFADMVSKSANYCGASATNSTGLCLLADVALGNTYDLTNAKSIRKLPKGKHSVRGIGATEPDSASHIVCKDGYTVPKGKGVQTDLSKFNDYTSLLYNEYIVYDVAQVNMKYLVKFKFEYKSLW